MEVVLGFMFKVEGLGLDGLGDVGGFLGGDKLLLDGRVFGFGEGEVLVLVL